MFHITFQITYFLNILLCVTNGTQYLPPGKLFFVLLKWSTSLPFLIMIKNQLCVCVLDFLTYVFSIANQHVCYAQILHLSFLPHKNYYCIMSALLSLLMTLFVVFYCPWHIIYIYIIFCIPNFIWNWVYYLPQKISPQYSWMNNKFWFMLLEFCRSKQNLQCFELFYQ